MRISLIAAMAKNRAIGLGNGLPWHLPADLKRFKALTTGHTLIIGRKTFETLRAPLPWRTTIVVTRRPDYAPAGVIVTRSIDEALSRAEGEEVFVAGGEDIFRQTLDRADRIYLTNIDRDYPGDTFFPEFDESGWELVEREDHAVTEEYPAFSFEIWERRAAT